MKHAMKIGVVVNSFRLPPLEGVRKAKEVGADGFQIYAVKREISPEQMDAAKRREFRRFAEGLGLEISALCGDLGGHGFERAEENPGKIERSKKIVDLAVDLGTRIVTTHIGCVPDDPRSPIYRNQVAACRELGDYAEKRGVTFAIETGPETAEVLKGFLDDVGSKGVGVNMDPANLVMVVADDPVVAVHTLRDYIVHTHAKDGVQLKPCDPVQVYGAFAEGGVAAFDFGAHFDEVPLGEGAVDWPEYLRALNDIGYKGYLTIEREAGTDRVGDIARAVQFLRAQLAA